MMRGRRQDNNCEGVQGGEVVCSGSHALLLYRISQDLRMTDGANDPNQNNRSSYGNEQ